MSDFVTTQTPVIPIFDPGDIDDPQFKVLAALYFLSGGHYMFRQHLPGSGKISKFVTATDVAAAFLHEEIDTGWMPAGVVRYGQDFHGPWFVYSPPAQKVEITLMPVADGETERTITVPMPRLVLLGTGSEYYLWAIKTPHFEHKATIYSAPLPNVYPDGKICWGNNTPPEADPKTARKAWELFFKSPFNNHLANGKSETHRNDVRKLLLSLAGKNKFPADELVPDRNMKRVVDALHQIVSTTMKNEE